MNADEKKPAASTKTAGSLVSLGVQGRCSGGAVGFVMGAATRMNTDKRHIELHPYPFSYIAEPPAQSGVPPLK
jgi:hypothetical protein